MSTCCNMDIGSKGAPFDFERPLFYLLKREGMAADEGYGRAHGGDQPTDGQVWSKVWDL